jgi:uncharacterized protein (DUF2062 family)
MSRWLTARKGQMAAWMRQGISPRRLALTLALGFAVGCIPVVGVPTLLCAGLALALRLNLPAIQAANYAAMPLQVALIWPLVRLGEWMFASGKQQAPAPGTLLHGPALQLLWTSGSMAGHALAAWLLLAVPAVTVMTLGFTLVLRRVPALAAEGAIEGA